MTRPLRKKFKSEFPVIQENNRYTVMCGTGMALGGFVQRGSSGGVFDLPGISKCCSDHGPGRSLLSGRTCSAQDRSTV